MYEFGGSVLFYVNVLVLILSPLDVHSLLWSDNFVDASRLFALNQVSDKSPSHQDKYMNYQALENDGWFRGSVHI